MSSKVDAPTDDSKNAGISDLFKKFDPTLSPIDYVKRFFYQILGIYFPPVVLILYLVLYWIGQPYLFPLTWKGNPVSPEHNLESFFNFINSHNQIIQLLLFIIGVAALGEAINSITSRIAKISPIKTNYREKLYHIRKDMLTDPTKISNWPIWLNITRFPVNFAHFDRYYVSVLEQDKKTLAGKIGWLSFYRNMTAIFIIIFVLQMYVVFVFPITPYGKHFFEIYLDEYYVLVIAGAAIPLFCLGYYSQVNAHRTTLWDAYRRNELRKNLEIRYGDLSVSLGVQDRYKKKILEYMVDRWFLAVEQSLSSLSSFLLSIVEKVYSSLKEKEVIYKEQDYSLSCFLEELKIEDTINPIRPFINIPGNPSVQTHKTTPIAVPGWPKMKSKDIVEIEQKVRELLANSYREWNIGGYSQVITNALKALELFHLSLTMKAWQTFRGYYNLENSLRTDAAFKEVQDNVIEWGWTYQNQSKTNVNVGKDSQKSTDKKNLALHFFNSKADFDDTANIISQSIDPYRYNFDRIMELLKYIHEMRKKHYDKYKHSDDEVHLDYFENLEVNINEKKLKIDGKELVLEPIDNGKAWKIDGKKIPKIDIDSNEKWTVDINARVSCIYYLFGSNKYKEAGQAAQRLLEDTKKGYALLKKINE
jgi:hypothetical protein